ncbi:MAG TPA: SEC-C domain-containing protein, partial [Kofleriaceae bacterium]|nr:SEC-C domain-containing protein [Kofleriaceae bacterium]
CGSGKKFKRCCGDPRAADRYTRDDRAAVFERLNEFIDAFAVDDERRAGEAFWGRFAGRADELPPERAELFDDIEHLWFTFDHAGAGGATIADRFLAGAELDAGQRAFLAALRRSSMRIYEVTDARPGASLTLRDAVEGGAVTVNERQASRTLARGDHLAARVVPHGPSGGPEIEAGLLHLAPVVRDPLLARIRGERARFFAQHSGGDLTAFYKALPPLFHEVWVGTMLEPGPAGP